MVEGYDYASFPQDSIRHQHCLLIDKYTEQSYKWARRHGIFSCQTPLLNVFFKSFLYINCKQTKSSLLYLFWVQKG